MKRFLAILAVSALVFTTFAACGEKNAPGNTSPATQTVAATQTETAPAASGPLFKDQVTLKGMLPSNASWPTDPNHFIFKALSEATNIKFDLNIIPDANYNDKVSLTVASGDLPDIIENGNHVLRNKYGDAGVFINMFDYSNQLPDFIEFYKSNANHQMTVSSYMNSTGKLYGLPSLGPGGVNLCVWYIRDDIFKANNLSIPNNYEELYNVCKVLKQKYPDAYPLTGQTFMSANYYTTNAAFNWMANQWSTAFPFYFDFKDNTWKLGAEMPSLKEYVIWLNKMYTEKLIPPDIATMNAAQWEELITTDRTFISTGYAARMNTYNTLFKSQSSPAVLKDIPPPAGMVNGQQKFVGMARENVSMGICSTSKKINEAIKYFDWLYTDQAQELVSWGKEGETYKVVNGQREWIKPAGREKDDVRLIYGLLDKGTYLRFDLQSQLGSDKDKEYLHAMATQTQYNDPLTPLPAFNAEEQVISNNEGVTIHTKGFEGIIKFIMGERDISEWDKFVSELKNLGTDKVLKILNDSYARTKK